MTFVAIELWDEHTDRRLCTDIILRVLPLARGDVATAVSGVFGRRHSLLADEETNEVLDGILKHPAVLAAADAHDLAVQLKTICAEEPRRVLDLCNVLLDLAQQAPDGVQRLASAGEDLINISLTLQRLHDHRTEGLNLFERLLEMGMYGARETLLELNVRPAATDRS